MFSPVFANPFPKSPYSYGLKTVQEEPQPDTNRYVNFNAGNDGCMVYRRGFVSNHIRMSGHGDVVDLTKMVTEKGFYQNVKCISLQRQAAPHQKQFVEYLKSIQLEFGFKLIYEVDDVVFREEIPDHNASKHGFDSDEIRQNCVDMINMVDEVTVTCQYMKDLYIEKTGQQKVTVVPNFMPHWWSGHQFNYRKICDNFEKFKKKPRVVYAGSGAHFDVKGKAGGQDDFTHVLKFIIDNRHKYQFVFIGAYPPPLHPYIQSKEIEFHQWVNLLDYPNFLASLNAQVFIAPLMDIPFNRSKSDIKFMEAAQLGIPCICQDMVTYKSAPELLRFKTADELAEKVELLTNWKNRSRYYKLVPELRKLGESRFLELPQNIGCFLEAFDLDYGDPRRKYLKKWNP
jgi:glycosyltransferase involved in cell wall biosynthesis